MRLGRLLLELVYIIIPDCFDNKIHIIGKGMHVNKKKKKKRMLDRITDRILSYFSCFHMFNKASKFCSHEYRLELKGLAMIFDGQENPFIIFRSKEIYIIQNKEQSPHKFNLLK